MGNVSTKEARSRSNSGRSSSLSQPSGQSKRHHRSARNQATGGDRAKGSDKKSNGGSLVLDPNEMVDGGYLAPHGVYSGPQTYKHKAVRQLMIERRLAPFFKGLADYDEDWSERQLLAAIRGIPLSAVNPEDSSNNGVTDGGSTGDLTSTSITEENTAGMHEDTTATSADILSSSAPNDDKGSLSTSPSKQAGPGPGSASSSPLPPHAESSSSESDRDPELEKILEMKGEAYHMEYSAQDDDDTKRRSQSVSSPVSSAANVAAATPISTRQRANTSSRYNQANGDGKPAELTVYKGSIECPICFLFYPKYLNHTRCCAQPICSECFVQIKRPDPHPPYHEGGSSEEQASTSNSNTTSEKEQHELVSEPACCPYCTAPDFGVIYIPPPFRTGLAQESSSKLHLPSLFSHHGSGTSTPASDQTAESEGRPRRHRTSVPPSAPEVVTTDQIRPDWSANLHAARQHQARRSAAANALHATAFLMNNNNEGGSSSSSSRTKKKKSSRLRGLASPSVVGNGRTQTPVQSHTASSGESSSRRGLEDMMLVEAIRLSLSEEDSRKKKEKEQKKKAKGKQPEGIPS